MLGYSYLRFHCDTHILLAPSLHYVRSVEQPRSGLTNADTSVAFQVEATSPIFISTFQFPAQHNTELILVANLPGYSTLVNLPHLITDPIFDSGTNPSFEYVLPSVSLSHTSTLSLVSTSTTFTTSPFQADQKHIAAEIEKEWETVWEVFPELSTNPGEPAMNQQFTPSTTQAIISTTQVCTNTTSFHAQPHNSGHLHHTNIPISNNSKKSKKSKKSKNPSPHITIPKRHAPANMFPATDFRLKCLKKSPLPFQHHKAILQPDHNTNPKSSDTTTTTTKLPPLNPEIPQKTQSTSTNIPSSVAVATTTTNTSTQTDTPIPALMQLKIPILFRIQTPPHLSPYHYHPPSYPPPSFPVPCRISSGWDSGGPPCHPIDNQRRSPSPGGFKATPHPTNGQRCTLTHTKNVFVQNSSQN